MNKYEGGWRNVQCLARRAASVGTWWLALRTRSCSAVCNLCCSSSLEKCEQRLHSQMLKGTTGHTSTVGSCPSMPNREEESWGGGSREAQTATRQECHMHVGTNMATRYWGEHEGKRCSFLSPQARRMCCVPPNASHMQHAYQDRSLPGSPPASILPPFPAGKTYLAWVLRVLFLRGKKKWAISVHTRDKIIARMRYGP